MQKIKLLPKGIYKGNRGRKLGTLVLVTALFFGISMLGYQREGVIVWACFVALYFIPFLLGCLLDRWWAVLISPIAYLLALCLWQLTLASSSLWYDLSPLGWLVHILLFLLIPMLIAGGVGLLIRRLIRR